MEVGGLIDANGEELASGRTGAEIRLAARWKSSSVFTASLFGAINCCSTAGRSTSLDKWINCNAGKCITSTGTDVEAKRRVSERNEKDQTPSYKLHEMFMNYSAGKPTRLTLLTKRSPPARPLPVVERTDKSGQNVISARENEMGFCVLKQSPD